MIKGITFLMFVFFSILLGIQLHMNVMDAVFYVAATVSATLYGVLEWKDKIRK